eukprot:TRINITY_DN22069_c0_g1_i2.p1 TRINITY_DN22069_c0_g1~~TRINITY_DN22069_c0_g1_i2.p1  ORF type:complete len:327 (+),score=72.80 TRINITY_DN22069_c0_g1_i2:84-1064(+)
MSSQEFLSVPVIDVQALVSDSGSLEDKLKVAEHLGNACHNVGFFYIKNHGISEELQNKLEELSRSFFNQDVSIKNQISMDKGGPAWRGYFPVGGELTSGKPDNKEGNPELKQTVLDYTSALTELGHKLMGGISLSLNLPYDFFSNNYTTSPLILFRIFNYPPNAAGDKETWGVGAHTDYGVLTILKQDESGGLEVKNRNNQWISAPPVPGTFVINIGDMLEKMTGCWYRSTEHRVRNPLESKHRISFPFFFDPNWDAKIRKIQLSLTEDQEKQRLELEKNQGGAEERWDGVNLHADQQGTYGDYLVGKVLKVFPELGETNIKPGGY